MHYKDIVIALNSVKFNIIKFETLTNTLETKPSASPLNSFRCLSELRWWQNERNTIQEQKQPKNRATQKISTSKAHRKPSSHQFYCFLYEKQAPHFFTTLLICGEWMHRDAHRDLSFHVTKWLNNMHIKRYNKTIWKVMKNQANDTNYIHQHSRRATRQHLTKPECCTAKHWERWIERERAEEGRGRKRVANDGLL